MGRAPHKKALEQDNAKDYRIVEEALKTLQMECICGSHIFYAVRWRAAEGYSGKSTCAADTCTDP